MAKSKSSAASRNIKNKSADSKFMKEALKVIEDDREMLEKIGRL